MSESSNVKPQVEYRRLGNSGLRVSVPILGGMSFGSDKWFKWAINEDQVSDTKQQVVVVGICIFISFSGHAVAQGGMGAWCNYLGYGERLLKWRI
jgi:hypothetical protein